ncbi:SAGA complex subunit spt3 [Zancudomyces culisetae]|uniref:SAGA complex subunit spt3 n=1 Tax=Zancudomyces culisetae TaxID=1213189 RepID=A0A1R1PLL9_ZANCU|nr:SAGA complex subunit spt3 [Zancudomyces culisetae]OMH81837.1 SAGA complex subunit spt3 [Zancudomyces culisetae]OMH84159.1 SAGA complex subunit spt3 [Zancudomyces culisetae]|eukprot:OMH80972.1 SAGA complex subunit spt3 [Zancudomyces culisetae]
MMFVFGEVQDPLIETTMIIENIVRSQVIEICIMASAQAQKRGSRTIAAEDLMFLIRHDKQKVNRLSEYLSWKDVRKKLKERDDNNEEILEEEVDEKVEKQKRSRIRLFWELMSTISENVDLDEDLEEQNSYAKSESIKRLKVADVVTRKMTRDEYVHYSECRQASFTYRKGKRFREWVNMQAYVDIKPNVDITDILGFLTFEMVSKLTESALKIKKELEESQKKARNTIFDGQASSKSSLEAASKMSLFSGPNISKTPLRVEHVREAYRRMQHSPQPIRNFYGGLVRTSVSLI